VDSADGTVNIGIPCDPSNCASCQGAGSTCLTGGLFANGYCTTTIAECPAPGSTMKVCPAGSACVAAVLSGSGEKKHLGDYCLKTCATSADCRASEGYGCCSGYTFDGSKVCMGGCP
jgi:hypothetical protein